MVPWPKAGKLAYLDFLFLRKLKQFLAQFLQDPWNVLTRLRSSVLQLDRQNGACVSLLCGLVQIKVGGYLDHLEKFQIQVHICLADDCSRITVYEEAGQKWVTMLSIVLPQTANCSAVWSPHCFRGGKTLQFRCKTDRFFQKPFSL